MLAIILKPLLLFLLLSFSLQAQKKMVKIEGFNGHQIEVNDSISEKTLKKFIHYMNTNPVNFEQALREIKAIQVVEEDRYYVSEFENGVIYLNSRLNDFPATKEIVILHHLAVNTGMQTMESNNPLVRNTAFNITKENEEIFSRQLERDTPYKFIVKQLKEDSPLKSKL